MPHNREAKKMYRDGYILVFGNLVKISQEREGYVQEHKVLYVTIGISNAWIDV